MSEVLVPIFGMLIPIVIVPTALGFKHARRLREMEHAERMRALEMGRRPPQDESCWSSPRISLIIAGGVPISVFFCAFLATQSVGYHEEIWIMAGMVGIAAVISGSVLAAKQLAQFARSPGGMVSDSPMEKLPMDEDAYDVVGSRG